MIKKKKKKKLLVKKIRVKEKKGIELRKKHTERGVLVFEAEIGERRSVCETLKNAVDIAGIAEVSEP